MPPRKLNQDDVEDLRIGWEELMQNKTITRPSTNDHDITITTTAGLAAWKDISPARFHELKREGWKLKQGVVHPPAAEPVVADAVKVMLEYFEQRVDELKAENAELRRQLKERK